MTAAETLRDPVLGFELDVPVGATVLDRSELGVVLELAGPDGADPARVVLTVEPVEPGTGLRHLADRALGGQGPDSSVIDRRLDRLGGLAADHSLSHREVAGTGVTVEEWRALSAGRLFTVMAGCPSAAYDGHADGFAALVDRLRVTHAEGSGEEPTVRFDPATALLVVTEQGFEALLGAARREPPGRGAATEVEALTACGALVAGRPHPVLESVLAPTLAPLLELTITSGDTAGRGWSDAEHASLLVPVGGGWRRRLAGMEASLLPGVLAGMLGLGPRPVPEGREPVELEVAQLGRLIARERGQARAGGAQLPPEAAAAVAGLRAHWRVDAGWVEEQRLEMLEVLDADRGLWLVVPQEGGVRMQPTHAAEVWRHLTGLIPT